MVWTKEKAKEYNKKYWLETKDKIKKYRLERKDDIWEYQKKYRLKNKNNHALYHREKYHSDIQYKLSIILRSRLHDVLKNSYKNGSSIRDLGCSIPELKFYIEGQFQQGMTWENWGLHGWHIDHKIPLAFFDLTDREQFMKACHYTNLQPLWAKDNLSKNKRIIYNSYNLSFRNGKE